MNKKLLMLSISIFIINNNFAKVGSIGLQKVRGSVVDALKNSTKLDGNSFKKFIKESKEEKTQNPKTQLADIIMVSRGSTVKGLPTYTSKIEKEADEQIEFSQNLIDNFIKWANQFELVELMANEEFRNNSPYVFDKFQQKIIGTYQDKTTIFTDFSSDIKEEQKNIDNQIKILNNLKDINEVKNNNKLSVKLNITVSVLNKLKNNIYVLIEKTNNLVGNSFNLLSAWIQLSSYEQPIDAVENVIETAIDTLTNDLTDNINNIRSPKIETRTIEQEEEPEIITTLPELTSSNIPQEDGNELTFQPFTSS